MLLTPKYTALMPTRRGETNRLNCRVPHLSVAAILDGKSLALEASHAPTGIAIQTFPRHSQLSLNWITGAMSRKVILI